MSKHGCQHTVSPLCVCYKLVRFTSSSWRSGVTEGEKHVR